MLQFNAHPYENLTPDTVEAAVEAVGFVPDGRLLALNSYENRVYQVGIEADAPIIAKFYRPDRWSTNAILEEHAFALELAGDEVPVIAPLIRDARTLFECAGFRFALFERRGGHWPELGTATEREWMGRFLGRLHARGRVRRFQHRMSLSTEHFAAEPREWLLAEDWIPEHLIDAYATVSADVIEAVEARFDEAGAVASIRLHGDCHPGNVLWTEAGPHFVDLDDCMMGPAMQDLWMLLSGSRAEMAEQCSQLLKGYRQFADFNYGELRLIEPLRSLRMMHYAGWLARRWSDPAFPRAFPWFAEPRYWEQHVLNLREQLAALQEEPIEVEL